MRNGPGISKIRQIEGFEIFEIFVKNVRNAVWRAPWASLGVPVAFWVPPSGYWGSKWRL